MYGQKCPCGMFMRKLGWLSGRVRECPRGREPRIKADYKDRKENGNAMFVHKRHAA